MQRFEYRSARFPTDIPLQYVDRAGEICGTCTEISRDGMQVDLADSVPADDSGRVRMRYGDQAVDLEVLVAYTNQGRCGMKFIYKSERERKTMGNLLATLGQRARISSL